ncbi:esterase [Intrasporangium oryzae NRRL B-24470]|uniref:Esterase n=1 Tax=Intrasporangium oryzae NRRL B-24470 TaxID=1386089 RepID=W9G814_9MICO|nr:alpha/beta hydrolase [Intrasporangium oryzae]EWT02170.1 esterase [Intrasporangium oryzae NRRL B-24470]
MANLRIPLLVGVAAAVAVGEVTVAFERDTDAAWSRLDSLDRKVVTTSFGAVDYAETGAGDPVLVSHGIFHGCDGGLLSVRDVLPRRRVIAPSRFGYLGSALPAGATPDDQADAFAELLDHLDVGAVDVVGISAGATAALAFALRHPGRTRHLVVLSGNLPGGPTAVAAPPWVRLIYAELPMWAMKRAARAQLAHLMGVPAGFPKTPEQAKQVDEMVESIFPVGPRAAGALLDAFSSNAAVNDLPIDQIAVPTIIIHAKDDPLCAFASAEDAARRIPGCTLVTQESGGHLGLGQSEQTRVTLDAFLTAPVAA